MKKKIKNIMSGIKEFILILPQLMKDIINGIINICLIAMWLILFPFIFIWDRFYGGWKIETKKEKNNT